MAETNGLLNRQTGLHLSRGFESRPLREAAFSIRERGFFFIGSLNITQRSMPFVLVRRRRIRRLVSATSALMLRLPEDAVSPSGRPRSEGLGRA